MKSQKLILMFSVLFSMATMATQKVLPSRYVVVPNRSDSTITILSTPTGNILKRITAQDTGFEFEPIYASHIKRFNLVLVSDRKNNQVMAFDAKSFKCSRLYLR